MSKRTATGHTERWPTYIPTAYSRRSSKPTTRWTDQDVFVAALCGALTALLLVSVLALVILAAA